MYGRRVQQVITIDDLINKDYYYYYNSDLNDDLCRILKEMYKVGQTLSEAQLESVRQKLMNGYGKRRALNYSTGCWEALELITKRHTLSDAEITAILTIAPSNWAWLDNLIANGKVINKKQMTKAMSLGYAAGITLLMTQPTAKLSDLNGILKIGPGKSTLEQEFNDKIKAFIDKFKLKPDATTFDVLEPEMWAFPEWCRKLVVILIEYNPDPKPEIFIKLNKIIGLDKISTYVEKYFSSKIIDSKTIESCCSDVENSHDLENITWILEQAKKYSMRIEPACLEKLSTKTKYNKDLNNLFGLADVRANISSCVYSSIPIKSEKYVDIIEWFLTNSLDTESINKMLEVACEKGDQILFDILIEKATCISDACLENTCGSSKILFDKLINMKCLPTIGCVDNITTYNPANGVVVLDDLLSNGLGLNLEVIKRAMANGIYISNFEQMGYVPDIELYRAMYELGIYPEVYLEKLKTNPSLNMDIRESIRTFGSKSTGKYILKTEEEIIKQIKLRNIVPDDIMYTHSIENTCGDLIKYFEDEWGMKPNITSLVKISDYTEREKYFKRLLELYSSVIPQEVLVTSPVIKENLCVPIVEHVEEEKPEELEQPTIKVKGLSSAKKIPGKKTTVRKRAAKKVVEDDE